MEVEVSKPQRRGFVPFDAHELLDWCWFSRSSVQVYYTKTFSVDDDVDDVGLRSFSPREEI